MQITFSPMRSDDTLSLHRAGDVLSVNGRPVDLSGVPEGGVLAGDQLGCDRIVGDIRRQDGILHLTLILPHGAEAGPETLFPEPLTLGADGPVDLSHVLPAPPAPEHVPD